MRVCVHVGVWRWRDVHERVCVHVRVLCMWGWRWRDVHVRVCVHVGDVEVEGCACEGVCM